MAEELQFDALPPARMISRMEEVGASKAGLKIEVVAALAILAGAFVALGAMFATAVIGGLPSGLARVLGGLAFSLGLVAIVATGAELFMGNNLLVMAAAGGRVKPLRLVRNWAVVFTGNALGALLLAGAMFLAGQYTFSGGQMGLSALATADARCGLGFGPALILGLLGGATVCLAVWLSFSARSITGKILTLVFPITALVAIGFEYSIANLYWVPFALLVKDLVPASSAFWSAAGTTAAAFTHLTWGNFLLNNLLPVTLGNLLGGAGLVALAYWFIALRPRKVVQVKKKARVPNILVVDDDPDFVEVTSMILDKEGYKVSTAYNGKEAWAAMAQKKPDMVLLDVMMSSTLEGVDLSRRMAADSKLKDVPIIMISSIDSTYHAGRLPDNIHLPIDAWLSKPVSPELLLRTIRRFLV